MLCGTETGGTAGLGAAGEQGRGGALPAGVAGPGLRSVCTVENIRLVLAACRHRCKASVGAFFLMFTSSGNAALKPRHLEFRPLKALVYHITAEAS